jgi:hypothetical protein
VNIDRERARITTAATTTIRSGSCGLAQIVIAVEDPGTSFTLKIQDQASPPFVFVPQFTAALPTDFKPIIIEYDNVVDAAGGIDAVTTGTPGALCVSVHVLTGDQIPT